MGPGGASAAVAIVGAVIVGASGCVTSGSERCANGRLCPAGYTCVDALDLCASPEEVAQCQLAADEAACTTSGIPKGICISHVCIPAGCGNGIQEMFEVCDDGNRLAGDGCSADCTSEEICGDRIVDPGVDEECDCGDDPGAVPEGCIRVNGDTKGICDGACRRWPQPVFAMWGADAANLAVVGALGTILHLDGLTWHYFDGTTDVAVFDVHGSSATDMWALGTFRVLRYDGTTWYVADDMLLDMTSLWVAAPDQVFVVGGLGIVRFFDGAGWTAQPTPINTRLTGVWATSPTDVFAVGEAGTIIHFDGESWTEMTSNTSENLNAVWGTASDDVVAVGENGTILHWDGASWGVEPTFAVGSFRDVWGNAPDNYYAVGDDGTVHYTGVSWMTDDVVRWPAPMNAVWGADDDFVYVAARNDEIFHLYNSELWQSRGECQPARPLECGAAVTGNTSGGPTALLEYTCVPFDLAGPERYFRFVPTGSQQVTIELVGATEDLELVVLEHTGGEACTAATCVAQSFGLGNEKVVFQASEPNIYTIVVDSVGAAAGSFRMGLSCGP